MERKHISSNHRDSFYISAYWNGSDEKSWKGALATCHIAISRNGGSHPKDTAEDVDGLNGIGKRCFTAMGDTGTLESNVCSNYFAISMDEGYL